MAEFNLGGANISDTFKYLLQVRDTKSRTLSTNKTFSGDDVSLMLGDDLTVANGKSLTIEDDAQFILVPSSFFVV